MNMPFSDDKPLPSLARIGESPTFAGLTRILTLMFAMVAGVVGYIVKVEVGDVLDRQVKMQDAIAVLSIKTADAASLALAAQTSANVIKELDHDKFNAVDTAIDRDRAAISSQDLSLHLHDMRIHCLENKTRCPQ